MRPKLILRRILSSLLSLSGMHSILEQLCLADRAFVLMYHRVMPSVKQMPYRVQPGMFVTTATFEKQLSYLSNRFEIVFLDELVAKVRKGEPIGRHCALTFDDGWCDNYAEAFPLLKKYGVPATIFLTTGYVGTQKTFWPEEISSFLHITGNFNNYQMPPSLDRFVDEINRLKRTNPETFREGVIELLKKKPPHDREKILAHLRSTLSHSPLRQMLSWEESREMAHSGLVRFGAHTVNHELLDQLPLPRVRDEVFLSRSDIESRVEQKVTTFAYPNGNHTEDVRGILTEAGFDAAVTTRKGFLEHGAPSLEIPRIALHEDVSDTIPMLRSKILLHAF